MGGATSDMPILVFGYLLLLSLCGLYFATVGVWLWVHVHPAVPIVAAVLALTVLAMYTSAAFTDPGILPRGALHDYLKRIDATYEAEHAQFIQPNPYFPVM
jgi:palmitoyltransferase ZDHHC9/14/18